jgi:MoaA/NifB/PqqE/SkfB family radical SAM enzyme
MKRPKGFMSFDMFQAILNELGDVLVSVVLFAFGEPFLNRELPRMIEACTNRNILTLTSTNGHCLQTIEEALRVVDAGLSALIIAMDGSTQEIYQTYRKFGDLEKVKRCTALIEEAKALRGSELPYTNLRSVITRDNQEDLPNIEKLARDLGVNMFSYKSLGCLTHDKKFKDYEPAEENMRRFAYEGSARRHGQPIRCPFPFRQPTIYWDGTVVGCGCAGGYAHDLETPFGRIGEQSFPEIWNSPHALKLRRSIIEGHGLPSFCKLCPYQGRIKDGSILSFKEIRPLESQKLVVGKK